MRRIAILIAGIASLIAQPAWAEIGRIKSFVGEVQVTRDGRTQTVQSGYRLEEGDVVSTGRRSRVGIAFVDNTRMALGPNSEIRLDEYRYNRARQRGSSVTTINRGSLGVDSGNITGSGRDRMRVRTPTSMLGVRGTTFVVEVN